MTGQSDYLQSLHDEGVRYSDIPLSSRKKSKILPDEKTLKALTVAVQIEFNASSTSRRDWLIQVNEGYRDYDLTAYDPSMLPVADMQMVRRSTTRARVDQAKNSMFSSLALEPFAVAEVDNDEPGEVAHHAGLALSEQLRNAEFGNVLSDVLKGVFVSGTGWLKDKALADENGVRLDVEYVDARALFLSPHNVRDPQQCNMMAHRYYESISWVRDMALMGLFDEKAARGLSANSARDMDDEGSTEREALHLNASEALMGGESGVVELLECYLRYRPKDDKAAEDAPLKPTEMWRVVVARVGFVVLRAERWFDGFPFSPIRAIRSSHTVYGTGFPLILKDNQFAGDVLWSTSLEGDILSATPFFEVEEFSTTGKMLKARAKGGGKIRIRPGDVMFRKGATPSINAIHFNPAMTQVDARLNRLEQDANVATVPLEPMGTYRSATEHRFAQAGVSAKENMMLRLLRTDLTRFLTRCADVYRRYVVQPYSAGTFLVQHGSQSYITTDQAWNALRWAPRGTTSQADVQLLMSSTAEAREIVKEYWALLPQMNQTGGQPAVIAWWNANMSRLETIGIQEWQKLIGDSPEKDPNLVLTDPSAIQAGQTILGLQPADPPQTASLTPQTGMSSGRNQQQTGPQPQGDAFGMTH